MKEHFKNKFSAKSKEELLLIIDNSKMYQPDAVTAAKECLEEGLFTKKEIKAKYIEQDSISGKGENDFFSSLKSINNRDVFTVFVNSSFISSVYIVFIHYQEELNFYNGELKWLLLLLFTGVLMNHIIYRLEHKRWNRYLTRIIFDALFFIFFLAICILFGMLIPTRGTVQFSIVIVPITLLWLICSSILEGVLNVILKLAQK